MAEYGLMKDSFQEKGFAEDCEYLLVDNSNGNQADAYQAIRHFLNVAKGKYVVLVHQDVRCQDERKLLENCLSALDKKDASWALCGNAGAKGYHQDVMHINTNGRIDMSDNLPCRVDSLDENLIIIDADKRISISSDLSGFHFYGTDLCLVADYLGYHAYVIPFMVKHLSHGNLKDMEKHRPLFIAGYGKKLRSRYIQTSCTKFYLSNSPLKNRLYNTAFIFFWIKAWQRLQYNFKLLTKGNDNRKSVTREK
jgi:hypothetical protein